MPATLVPKKGNSLIMATLTVGKGRQFSTIASAVNASRDGDVVAVNAGVYVDDFVTVNTRITIQGVGGMVELVAAHAPSNRKGIFVTNTDVTLDHLSFSGAAVADGNGAGVRYQGGNLTIINSYFHDNENGLLANAAAKGTITIRNSEFSHNGRGDGYTHNLYVGEIANLTIDRSYFHDAVVGHEIKSRAQTTTITNSRIVDGAGGTASYSVDLPNGGHATLTGNLIEQGPKSGNPAIVHFGGEGNPHKNSSLRMDDNTVVNDLASNSSRVVLNQTKFTVSLADTKVIGLSSNQIVSGPASVSGTDFLDSRPVIDTSSPWATAGQSPPAPPVPPPAPTIPPPVVLPPATGTTVGNGPDSLVLKVSEQAWNGDAQFIVKVDGTQVGGTFTAKANHALGTSEAFTLKGNWGAGAHKVEVNFTNDGWNGNALQDRNLYLDEVAYNGKAVTLGVVEMLAGGPVKLNVPAAAAPAPAAPVDTGTVIGIGKDALVIKVSEQAWKGDAEFTVKVDGVQVGGTLTATASHALAHSDTFMLKGNWGSGDHKVEVRFTNDAWNGNAAEDRNLYVDGMSYNGSAVPASTVEMKAGGAVAFSVAPSAASRSASDTLVTGTSFADPIKSLGGNDSILRGAGDERLDGGDGNGTPDGGTGSDLMIGREKNDASVVDDTGDSVTGLAGGGHDKVTASVSWAPGGKLEALEITGTTSSATGDALDNVLVGNTLPNILNGMAGNDGLQGGGGNDTLLGGLGRDILGGGLGSDAFRFAQASEGGDTILDFAPGQDVIDISVSGFGGGLATSTDLAASGRFLLNDTGVATASAGIGQFIYETDAAKLWWDADGAGAGVATEIATFAMGTSLGSGDIHLIG